MAASGVWAGVSCEQDDFIEQARRALGAGQRIFYSSEW
jgi:hypothetical protein